MFERYTEKARRVIFFARYEASQFGSPHIESQHLLLGLLREDKALTNRFLRSQVSVEAIRKQIEGHSVIRESIATSVDLPLANDCKRILAYAAEEAERLAHQHIGTEHLLLGILREKDCFAAKLLEERGIAAASVRAELAAAPHVNSSRPAQGVGTRIGGHPPVPVFFVSAEGETLLRQDNHLIAPLPRVGDSVLLGETGESGQRYRVTDVQWQYTVARRKAGVPEISQTVEKIRQIVTRMETAIANHEFAQARACSEEERAERLRLRELYKRHGVKAAPDPAAKEAGQELGRDVVSPLRQIVITLATDETAGA